MFIHVLFASPKDAMKAIRKRLSMNVGKNYTAVMYTLTVGRTHCYNAHDSVHLLYLLLT